MLLVPSPVPQVKLAEKRSGSRGAARARRTIMHGHGNGTSMTAALMLCAPYCPRGRGSRPPILLPRMFMSVGDFTAIAPQSSPSSSSRPCRGSAVAYVVRSSSINTNSRRWRYDVDIPVRTTFSVASSDHAYGPPFGGRMPKYLLGP
jgi:hypothetical protein